MRISTKRSGPTLAPCDRMKSFLLFLTGLFLISSSRSEGKPITLDFVSDTPPHLRHEVQAFIKKESGNSLIQKRALFQLARDYSALISSIQDESKSKHFAKRVIQSEFCVRSAFPYTGYEEAAKLHGLILNNYSRARLGIRLNTILGKALPYTPKRGEWRKDCRF